ncbi:MAG: molecular chaperone DnaK [Aeromonas media]|nr:MAG: molecular chaperone DnaK [Aeromonas media]
MQTTEQINKLRQILKEKRDALQREIYDTTDSVKPVVLDQSSVGRLSRMDAIQTQQMQKGLLVRKRIHMLNIDAALKRIEIDDYGYCVQCGEDIDFSRLLIDPSIVICVACCKK